MKYHEAMDAWQASIRRKHERHAGIPDYGYCPSRPASIDRHAHRAILITSAMLQSQRDVFSLRAQRAAIAAMLDEAWTALATPAPAHEYHDFGSVTTLDLEDIADAIDATMQDITYRLAEERDIYEDDDIAAMGARLSRLSVLLTRINEELVGDGS